MKLFWLSVGLLTYSFSYAQNQHPLATVDFEEQQHWVDSVYTSLSTKEKIAQLFMVDVFSEKDDKHTNRAQFLIENYGIGGVIFSKGGPYRQAKLTNEFQQAAKVPLLIGMDVEWGLAMRLDSTYAFPWNMTLGAITKPEVVKKVGYQIGKHNKRLGVHINFAPVADLNTNPKNPIIGNRSFGENKERVSQNAIAFMQGMHEAGVLSNAKHFPGHGDTAQDSHKTLPSILFSEERIKEVELYPFKALFDAGVSSVMVAHLNVPSLEKKEALPTTLSQQVVTELLQNELKFKGLVITDALNMKGVSKFSKPGKVDLDAFLAGNDILLISEDIPQAIEEIHQAYVNEIFTENRLAHSVKKILMAKYKAGLHQQQKVEITDLYEDLNTIENEAIEELTFLNAVTLVKNDLGVFPILFTLNKKIAYVSLGDDGGKDFLEMMNIYQEVHQIRVDDNLLTNLKAYDEVIIGHHISSTNPWKSYAFSEEDKNLIDLISKQNSTFLFNFASPYAISDLNSYINIEAIVQVYQNTSIAQKVVAQMLFGAQAVSGKLPVSIRNSFPEGTGFSAKKESIYGYNYPSNLGFDIDELSKIDSIAQEILDEKMAPGFQILVARKGNIVYQKNFGFQTYSKQNPVVDNTIYDLASLTKILGTLPILMMAEEQAYLDLETTKLSDLMQGYADSNKGNLSLKKMLSHYAKLQAWIPFYQNTLNNFDEYYRTTASAEFSIPVTENLFLRSDYKDSIFMQIKESELRTEDEYKYSDLPFYILRDYLEELYGSKMDELTEDFFYSSMGLKNLKYFPLNHFKYNQIAPSEKDTLWRKQIIKGTVHDQGAAMLGGIGGHAGLFGNVEDVAKMMLMYLNGGDYAGKQYLRPSTIDKFNTCYYCEEEVRRGIVFDKPQLEDEGPTCGCLSMKSFGHSGFTGTYAWADPEEEIVYVFLSNRTFPDASNAKLIESNARTRIQEVIYDALLK